MDRFNEIFSKNLRAFMNTHNLTQRDLAKHMNVSESSVSHWMAGTKVPRADKVDKLCEIFGCKRSDFLNENDDIPISPAAKKHMENYSQLTAEWQKTIDELVQTLQSESPDSDTLLEVIGKITTILHS